MTNQNRARTLRAARSMRFVEQGGRKDGKPGRWQSVHTTLEGVTYFMPEPGDGDQERLERIYLQALDGLFTAGLGWEVFTRAWYGLARAVFLLDMEQDPEKRAATTQKWWWKVAQDMSARIGVEEGKVRLPDPVL